MLPKILQKLEKDLEHPAMEYKAVKHCIYLVNTEEKWHINQTIKTLAVSRSSFSQETIMYKTEKKKLN